MGGNRKVAPFRALVLAGDANANPLEGLKKVLVEVLVDLKYGEREVKELVREEVDPLYVAAVGAAMKGRDMVKFPGRFLEQTRGDHGEL